MDLDTLPLSDGYIVSVTSNVENVTARFIDWEQNTWIIKFLNVLAVEFFNPEKEELDRISVSREDTLIDKARRITREPELLVFCYSFFSAWSEEAVLRVIANAYTIESSVAKSGEVITTP